MVAVDLSAFMQQVIERVGREPDRIDGNSYTWLKGDEEIELIVGDKLADIEVELHVNQFALDENDSYYHHFELTESESDNGTGIGTDGSSWTYDDLIETVSCQVATTLSRA